MSQRLRATYFSRSRQYYDFYLDVLLRMGDEEAAFQTSERARARALLDAVATAGGTAELGTTAIGTRAARALLDDDTLAIELALTKKRAHLFALTATSARVHELPPPDRIETAARLVVALIGARNDRGAGEPAAAHDARVAVADAVLPAALRALSELVLGPIAGELGRYRRLVIAADGALQFVPFAALPAPGGGDAPLVASHELVSLPSLSVLAAERRAPPARPAASRVVAVLADPVFQADDERLSGRPGAPMARLRGRDVARLYFSRAEAETIAGMLPPGEAFLALDFAASRATALGPEVSHARIVHFATHGLVDSRSPEGTGLVLSLVDEKGAPQPGFLGLDTIYQLELDAELVVLSACQTALGKVVRGEGLLGLMRGFMFAGVPRVVASLWAVHDRATADLMSAFYAGMLQRGLGPSAALREAQLALLGGRWRQPYYWAAFTLYGDWRRATVDR